MTKTSPGKEAFGVLHADLEAEELGDMFNIGALTLRIGFVL